MPKERSQTERVMAPTSTPVVGWGTLLLQDHRAQMGGCQAPRVCLGGAAGTFRSPDGAPGHAPGGFIETRGTAHQERADFTVCM